MTPEISRPRRRTRPAAAEPLRRALRILFFGVLALVILAGAAVGGAVWWSLPATRIEAAVPALSAPVHIALDGDGIPRIKAANDTDAVAALGFVHARDRMFQMELMRRNASGRLSELVGGSALRQDRYMRTIGLRRRAETELAALDPATRARLDAYAAGVNAWIARRGRFSAPEFIPLGAPEPWTPVDSLLWGKTMALYLSGNYRDELARLGALQSMSPERVRALWPRQGRTLPSDARLGPAATRLAAIIPAFPAPFTQPRTASDEWAVDGANSVTGSPLLAGDPHLGYSMPGIWYLARIDTPTSTLAGATAPGLPFLVLGRNRKIAWTFTTAGADTQDVFIETGLPDGRYQTPDGPRAFESHEERIKVRGQADEVIQVRETRHGPVLSDLDGPGGPILAMSMAGLAAGDTAADGLLALNRAASVAEAGVAAGRISAPVQNMLVADSAGIGLFTTGRVPLRRAGDGALPEPGASGAFDWAGFASGDALPHETNPASGRLVNGNERVAGPDFPVFMGADWFGDWRARRIRELLDTRSTHSVNSFSMIQGDVTSAFAQSVLPWLLQTKPADAKSRVALTSLRRWDGTMRLEWPQPLLFNDWMRRFVTALKQRDDIPPGLGGMAPDQIGRALGPDGGQWCAGDCDALLAKTLSAAAGAYDRGRQWGAVHQAEFPHPLLSQLPLVGRFFVWSIEQPGDGTTLFRGDMRGRSWAAVHGPSYRGVYDLADLDRSAFAIAPGQSGNPFSGLAGNWLHRWRDDKTIRLAATVEPAAMVELHP